MASNPPAGGRLLRALRERALLTQEELAYRAGVSVGTVAGLESGRTRRPRSGSVRLLADALGLSAEDRAALTAACQPGHDARAVAPGIRPAQLPADLPDFSGRDGHLARLDELLPGEPGAGPAGAAVATITGTAGIGKTTLAVHWAHRVAGRFGDGQLYVNLRGFDPSRPPMEPAEAVRGFLEALGVAPDRLPTSLTSQVGLYRSLLAGHRLLVLLDNARDANQVRPLLPASPGCLALVTSRNQLSSLAAVAGAQPITVDLLSAGEARQLLQRRLGHERLAGEPEAVDELVAGCAGLPLALAIVAARAASYPDFPLRALAAELRTAGGVLDAFAGGDPDTDLRAVFSWSYDRLAADPARLFRQLGLPAGPDISAAAAASLAGIAPARARALLAELARTQLITEHAPSRYRLHDLLRTYAAELSHTCDTSHERTQARRRLLDHYLHTAVVASLLFSPDRHRIHVDPPAPGVTAGEPADRRQATEWFDAELPVLLAAIEYAAGSGFDVHAWQLAWATANVLARRGLWHDQVATHRVALAAAHRLGDQGAQAQIHHGLAKAHALAGRFEDADTQFRQAVDRFRALDNHAGQADCEQGIGWVRQQQGRHQEALSHHERALALYRAAGHLTGQARVLNNIGWQYAQLGDFRSALTHCREALALHRAGGDIRGQATAWDSLGYAHHHLGDRDQAATCYQQALVRFREVGDRFNEADTLIHLGDTHEAAGRPAAARDAWTRSLAILEELHHPDADHARARLSASQAGRQNGRAR